MTVGSEGADPGHPALGALTVLVVCTGNLCRSPVFAGLLSARLGRRVHVVSRGTQAVAGAAPPAETVEAGRRLGLDLTGHRARELEDTDLDLADLVLVASRRHRRDVVRRSPRSATKVFTVLEFARLADAVRDDRGVSVTSAADDGGAPVQTVDDRSHPYAVVDAVVRFRGLHRRPASPDDDDVVDPIGRRAGVHRRVSRQLAVAADQVADAFSPPSSDPGSPVPYLAHRVSARRRPSSSRPGEKASSPVTG